VNAGQNRNAANALSAFVNKVEAQRGKKVSEADADALVSDAQGTIMLLRTGHVAGSQTALDVSPGRSVDRGRLDARQPARGRGKSAGPGRLRTAGSAVLSRGIG